jgi:hypothetical protein
MNDPVMEIVSPSKTGEVRRCIGCGWETNYIVKKENGECPRCHDVVKYIRMDADENKMPKTREALLNRMKERYQYLAHSMNHCSGESHSRVRGQALEIKRIIEEAEGTYDHATGAKLD